MFKPSKEEFTKLAKEHNLVPVYAEIMADIDTPVSAYMKLGENDYSFLLESVEGAERWARYSFLVDDPFLVINCKDGEALVEEEGKSRTEKGDPFAIVKRYISEFKPAELPELPPFQGGAVGFFSYDSIRYIEDIPKNAKQDLDFADATFMFANMILIFDHLKHKIKVVINAKIDDEAGKVYKKATAKIKQLIEKMSNLQTAKALSEPSEMPKDINSNIEKKDFIKAVDKVKEYIVNGDVIQVVLSQRFNVPLNGKHPFDIYRILRTLNPSPYMYYLNLKDIQLVGCSPEALVKVQSQTVTTRPIAGTRRRGNDEAEDFAFEVELKNDEKEKAEHLMLLDLGRNDMGRVCMTGSIIVDEFMGIEKYSHVMHMVSSITGQLAKGKDAFDVIKALFPAGTVSGAPKIRAMEIIDELEPTLRGPYAGSVGYFGYNGNLDMAIAIRTIVIKDGQAYVQAGAGIVYDSDPELEYKECQNKARALLKALGD
ncbi:MAG: anthranilate synthase component I [Actinobacteria bacterium]|nr:MAG: anthranilate synthase component I [Actinomycetota bacterium]